MTDARYQFLMGDDEGSQSLTTAEIQAGWHYCVEFDGLLIRPGMGETKHCFCPSVKKILTNRNRQFKQSTSWCRCKNRLA
jgi:hypothetical protein